MELSVVLHDQQNETQHNLFKKMQQLCLGIGCTTRCQKYQEDIGSVKTEKFKCELDKFLELIPCRSELTKLNRFVALNLK